MATARAGISGPAGGVTGRICRTPSNSIASATASASFSAHRSAARAAGRARHRHARATTPAGPGTSATRRRSSSATHPTGAALSSATTPPHSRHVVPIVECPVHAAARQSHRLCAARASRARAAFPRPGRRCAACCAISLSARRATSAKRWPCSSSPATTSRCARPFARFSPPKKRPTASISNIHDKPGPVHGRVARRCAWPDAAMCANASPASRFSCRRRRSFRPTSRPRTICCDSCSTRLPDRASAECPRPLCRQRLVHAAAAARGHDVTAVEENAQAMKDADSNLRLNRIAPAPCAAHRERRGRAGAAAPRPVRPGGARSAATGCSPPVIRTALRTAPRAACRVRVVQSRSAGRGAAGDPASRAIEMRRVQPVDMFPHTTHIETWSRCVTLGRVSADRDVHRTHVASKPARVADLAISATANGLLDVLAHSRLHRGSSPKPRALRR